MFCRMLIRQLISMKMVNLNGLMIVSRKTVVLVNVSLLLLGEDTTVEVVVFVLN